MLRADISLMERLRPRIKNNARTLRHGMTDAERVLWHHLRNRAFHGYKFRRQYAVSAYILDFYCAELALGIEGRIGPIWIKRPTKDKISANTSHI